MSYFTHQQMTFSYGHLRTPCQNQSEHNHLVAGAGVSHGDRPVRAEPRHARRPSEHRAYRGSGRELADFTAGYTRRRSVSGTGAGHVRDAGSVRYWRRYWRRPRQICRECPVLEAVLTSGAGYGTTDRDHIPPQHQSGQSPRSALL